MKNPWEEISLTDYENHMKLDSVMQLQTLNEMMKGQFETYPVSSVMVLGIAGGWLSSAQDTGADAAGREKISADGFYEKLIRAIK